MILSYFIYLKFKRIQFLSIKECIIVFNIKHNLLIPNFNILVLKLLETIFSNLLKFIDFKPSFGITINLNHIITLFI